MREELITRICRELKTALGIEESVELVQDAMENALDLFEADLVPRRQQ